MNEDSPSDSEKVTSKYFSSKTGMDESLSDFQEKKKISVPKTTKPKPKPKKPLKKPRGQKDIRAALKAKKSELVSYAKDFDNVCKQSGIDVDSEQLQLAIALSKSIQPSCSDSQDSQPNSQERTARIRSTLQQYGFTVPEIKISNPNKRVKKHKKNYKLLLLSEAEKQQNIADKYSQVLLQNIDQSCSPKKKVEYDNFDKNIYFLSTHVCYEAVKNDNVFYLDNLPLERSSNKGSLLRDWSKIPGRPVSPNSNRSKDITMDVSELLCSQEELNIVLSGALKSAQNVLRHKLKVTQVTKHSAEVVNTSVTCDIDTISVYPDKSSKENKLEEADSSHNESLFPYDSKVSSELGRSCSPDIFDEEPTSFYDSKVNINIHDSPEKIQNTEPTNKSIILTSSLGKKHATVPCHSLSQNVTKRKSNDFMEMTKCLGVTLNPMTCSVMRTDVTKRKTNDFMDLTECVIQEKVHFEGQIDLTQNFDEEVTGDENKEKIEINDLTQSSNSNDSLPSVHVSDKNNDTVDETIIFNESEIDVVVRSPGKEDILIEATPEVDESKAKLFSLSHVTTPPKKSTSVEDSSNDTIFEDFEYNHSHSPNIDYNNDTIEKSIPEFEIKYNSETDLTQSPVQKCNTKKSESVLEDNNPEINLTQSPESNNDTIERSLPLIANENNIEMDLTQNSTDTEDSHSSNNLAIKFELCNKSSLGKKDDISIDYDEITHDASSSMHKINVTETFSNNVTKELSNCAFSTSKIDEANSSETHLEKLNASQISKESEVFEISDNELNYSVQKSRYEDCLEVNFVGVSFVGNNFSSNRNNSSENVGISEHALDKFESDSFLPEVNVKKQDISKECNTELSPISKTAINNIIETPRNNKSMKHHAVYDIVKTPGNKEYVIKTDQVTPMGDYISMSTPDRNKELEKYGLKPLKRKRAIQLLTHIYNQTHPIVEPCSSEILQSPKKRKTEFTPNPEKLPRKNIETKISPRKKITSNLKDIDKIEKEASPIKKLNNIHPILNGDIDYEIKDNIYEMTNERVEIRDIECAEEDWVFQKREKAKLRSCRVPLHIAFHNYVSCRRGLREAILRYEPVNIDVIHKDMASSGHRYDPKDLLKFLDKKCITVKTVDNNSRNNRK